MGRRVKLINAAGVLVGYTDHPPFQTSPEVLLWGERLFMIKSAGNSSELPVYREAFLYVLNVLKLDDQP